MLYRRLGRTGRDVSAIGFGAWAIGADWGNVDDTASMRALHAAAADRTRQSSVRGGHEGRPLWARGRPE